MISSSGGAIGIAIGVVIDSGTSSTGAGLQLAFTVFAVVRAASALFVVGVAEMGSAHRRPSHDLEAEGTGNLEGRVA